MAGQALEPFGEDCWHLLASYTERTVLQKGRHSTVWACKHPSSKEVVVLKSYSKEALKARQMQSVLRETRILELLQSSCGGIVRMLAAFEDAQHMHIVFEACMRGDLYQLLMKEPTHRLPEQLVAQSIVVPLLLTLAEMHGLGVVHRDIKPENVFVSMEGQVQLGDFGLAAQQHKDSLTERVGTLDYLAPEVLSQPTPDEVAAGRGGQLRPYDAKVDIWALGCMVFELLSGTPPFEVEDPKETARLILAAKHAAFPPGLSLACCDFLRLTLSRKAVGRPSARMLLDHAWLKGHVNRHMVNSPPPGIASSASIPPQLDFQRARQASPNGIPLTDGGIAIKAVRQPSPDSDRKLTTPGILVSCDAPPHPYASPAWNQLPVSSGGHLAPGELCPPPRVEVPSWGKNPFSRAPQSPLPNQLVVPLPTTPGAQPQQLVLSPVSSMELLHVHEHQLAAAAAAQRQAAMPPPPPGAVATALSYIEGLPHAGSSHAHAHAHVHGHMSHSQQSPDSPLPQRWAASPGAPPDSPTVHQPSSTAPRHSVPTSRLSGPPSVSPSATSTPPHIGPPSQLRASVPSGLGSLSRTPLAPLSSPGPTHPTATPVSASDPASVSAPGPTLTPTSSPGPSQACSISHTGSAESGTEARFAVLLPPGLALSSKASSEDGGGGEYIVSPGRSLPHCHRRDSSGTSLFLDYSTPGPGTATPVEGEVASRVCSVTAIASPYAGLAQPGGSAESECRAGGAGSLCVQQRGGSSDGPQLAVADSSSGMRGKQGVGKSRFAR